MHGLDYRALSCKLRFDDDSAEHEQLSRMLSGILPERPEGDVLRRLLHDASVDNRSAGEKNGVQGEQKQDYCSFLHKLIVAHGNSNVKV
jgi:hypothetical protein